MSINRPTDFALPTSLRRAPYVAFGNETEFNAALCVACLYGDWRVRYMERRDERAQRRSQAFTLVELLVVIAIIGVLVALLLPAIQAAREAARRSQCSNNVKQMMMAMQNHESALNAFPSGGVSPWPRIEDFLTGVNGSPLGPDKQGLSWAFQILPYLEGQTIFNLKTTAAIEQASVPMFHCPSRRPPTRYLGVGAILMDYAAAVPFRTRGEIGSAYDIGMGSALDWGTKACQATPMWNKHSGGPRFQVSGDGSPTIDATTNAGQTTAESIGAGYAPVMGVIVRSDYCSLCSTGKKRTGFYTRISFDQIIDGSSNTMVISEKKLSPNLYDLGAWHDDRGWSDGWDPDTLRMTCCIPGPDSNEATGAEAYKFGSAHTAGMNAGFADSSVRTIRYDIDIHVFNYLGHRADEETIDTGSL
jgi:prepilin-type N-terminal cleavage/methylation domain-containing protein